MFGGELNVLRSRLGRDVPFERALRSSLAAACVGRGLVGVRGGLVEIGEALLGIRGRLIAIREGVAVASSSLKTRRPRR